MCVCVCGGGRLPKGPLLVEIVYQGFTLNNNGVLIMTNGSDDNTAFELGSGGVGHLLKEHSFRSCIFPLSAQTSVAPLAPD